MKMKWISFLLIIGFILPSASMAQPRDPVRDPIKVYKVAILPFLIHSQENLDYLREGIYDILLSRITVEGRIEVIERALVERALYEERPMRLDEASASKIGTRVGADYIVLGSLTKIGNYISLDARMISVTEEKPPLTAYTQHKGIDDVMVKIGDFAHEIGFKIIGRRPMVGRQAEPGYPSQLYKPKGGIERIGPESLGYKKSQKLNFEIKGLDIGDVDGDKKNEVVVMDTYHLYIFKYDGDKLSLMQKIESGYEHNFLTLDVADVNRNGYAEIIVTSIVEDNLRSFIIEFEEGKFKKINDQANWFFRVLDLPKDGPTLAGQYIGGEGILEGPIYRFIWKKKSYVKGPKIRLPADTNLFGLALANVRDKEKSDILVLDQFDRLRIISPQGKDIWSSKDHFGGTTNFYETKKKKDPVYRYGASPAWRVYIPGRIVIKDLDGDGLSEVIINKNESGAYRFLDRARWFEKGEIYDLVWDEGTFIPNWKTMSIDGYISDFQVKDIDGDGNEELVVAVIDLGGILDRKNTSNILFFKLF